MEKIALITDSSCDLPKEILIKNNIEVIPLNVIYANREYKDGIDITPEEVAKNLDVEIPKTSMPSPSDVLNKIESLKKEGYTHCIIITISSGLSGTYNMFKMITSEIQDMVVEVFDSKILSLGLGFIVLQAAKLIQQKLSFNEIIDKLYSVREQVKGYFIVDTLEYLKKGGRIGRVTAAIGSLLNIKPIISVDENGKYFTFNKARGKNQALDRMLDELKAVIDNGKYLVGIPHGCVKEEALKYAEKIKSLGNIEDIIISQISPALLVHSGPGLIGLVFMPV
ncbi:MULTISPECIES: DegV family protein [Caloramator]|uniref:EDD domain protein, DegV family n=1 Tax=Caloramator proteoclasticus DSM 10124 TaxID=1121262 RepID=A0A1M5BTH6_9CLOT|nr:MULTISPECIES: DegV family protein [Caloramator]SHF45828.1 EDD domain protein, DegV family [Caloramator proteoclasticus DSM 10124]